MYKNLYRPKHSASFITLSEIKRLTNPQMQQLHKTFSPFFHQCFLFHVITRGHRFT